MTACKARAAETAHRARPRGATPRPRSGAAAKRSYPASDIRGGSPEELRRVQGQGQWPRVPGCDSSRSSPEKLPLPQARGSGWEKQPHIQGAVAAWAQEGLEELFTFKVRRGGGEQTPLVQGKEQWLRFAGAALIPHVQGKRNQSKMVGVARGHQRADTMKP